MCRWLERAADGGSRLGSARPAGPSVTSARMCRWLERAADGGSRLGSARPAGPSVTSGRMCRWLERAADGGSRLGSARPAGPSVTSGRMCRWLERAADGGSRLGSARAQTMLAMLLARRDTLDLQRSFFWHSEATGNGSLESQGTEEYPLDMDVHACITVCVFNAWTHEEYCD